MITGARSRSATTTTDAFDKLAAETGQTRACVMEEWGERAAIRQYLGNLTIVEAEARAFDDVRAMFVSRQGRLF